MEGLEDEGEELESVGRPFILSGLRRVSVEIQYAFSGNGWSIKDFGIVEETVYEVLSIKDKSGTVNRYGQMGCPSLHPRVSPRFPSSDMAASRTPDWKTHHTLTSHPHIALLDSMVDGYCQWYTLGTNS